MPKRKSKRVSSELNNPSISHKFLLRYKPFRWLASHPKVSVPSGLGMAGTGLGTVLGGAPKLGALFFFISFLIWAFVIYVSPLWQKRRAWALLAMIALAVGLGVFWWFLLPQHNAADEIADAVAKRLSSQPQPTPKPTPDFLVTLKGRYSLAMRDREGKAIKESYIAFLVSIKNRGAPSSASGWSLLAQLPGRAELVRGVPVKFNGELSLTTPTGEALMWTAENDLIDKAGDKPIPTSGEIEGIITFMLPGVRVEGRRQLAGTRLEFRFKDSEGKLYGGVTMLESITQPSR